MPTSPLSFVNEALGAVLLRGGTHGPIAVAFSVEDAAAARLAWPDAAVFSPREIEALTLLRGDRDALASVLAVKRVLGGMVLEVRGVALEEAA